MILNLLLFLSLISPKTSAAIGEGDFPHELSGGNPTYYPVGHLYSRENDIAVDRLMKVKKKNTWKGVPVHDEMDIYRGDLIKVGDSSLAEIKLNNGGILKVGPHSILQILDQKKEPGQIYSNLDLWEGNLRSIFLEPLSEFDGEINSKIITKRTVVISQGQSDIAVQYKDKDRKTVTVASFKGKTSVKTTPDKAQGNISQDELLADEYMQTRIEKGEDSITHHNAYKPTKILEHRRKEIMQGFMPIQEGTKTWIYETAINSKSDKGIECPVVGKECAEGLICNYINDKQGLCTDPNIDDEDLYCKADVECKSNVCESNECKPHKFREERGTNFLRFFLGMQAAYLENNPAHTTFWSSQIGYIPSIRLLSYLHLEPYADVTFGSTNFSTTFFRTGARLHVYIANRISTGGGVGLFWYNNHLSSGGRDISADVGYSFPLNYFVDSLRFTYINSKGSGKNQFAFSFGFVVGFGRGLKRVEDER